jgi:nucleoside-diphosphate-sugar epimerase
MPVILITGAAGYVGKAAAAYFSSLGWTVHGTSRKPAPNPVNKLFTRWIRIDKLDGETDWRSALDSVDFVLHLAGIAHVPAGTATDEAYFKVNSEATAGLAKACVAAQVKRLIFLSSVGVNGQTSGSRPFREDDVPVPENAYARSKLEAEKAIRTLMHSSASQWVIFRAPMIYGPGAPGNFSRLLRLVSTRLPLPIGDATALRSFLGIDNLLDAIRIALIAPQAVNQLFLLCDGQDISSAKMAHLIASSLGHKVWLPVIPVSILRMLARPLSRELDVRRLFEPLQIDCSSWIEKTSWKAPVSIEEGIANAVARS